MAKHASRRLRLSLLISSMLLPVFLTSCTFCPSAGSPYTCPDFEKIPVTPSQMTVQPIFENPGTFIVMHGSATTKIEQRAIVRVEQSLPIPAYATQAAVFLNGWRLSYLGGDQNVLALGSAIGKIRTDPNAHTLTWDAIGGLTDGSFKQGFSWTYQFTAFAWNDANLHLAVDQGLVDGANNYCSGDDFTDNYFYSQNANTATALSSFFSFIQNNAFAGKNVAVLPRGFGFTWDPCGNQPFGKPDHSVLQLAYNLDHSDVFAENGKSYNIRANQVNAPLNDPASLANAGFVSWNPYAIFKDNDTRRNYFFGELVSGLAGAEIGVLQPPFSVLPVANPSCFLGFCSCGGPSGVIGGPNVISEDHVIENVPFEFAIPMLTGWELEYLCSDQHVKEVGVWIDSWSYQRPHIDVGTGGILRYRLSHTLRDNGNWPHSATHKVTLLGFGHVQPIIVIGGGGNKKKPQ